MKIGLIARLSQPIHSQAVGYYYKLYHLIAGLKQRGHQVTVLAHPQSRIKARLVPAQNKYDSWETSLFTYRKFIEKYSGQLDVINSHTDHLACYLDGYAQAPLVHTIVFGGFWGQVEEALRFYRKQNFIAISQAMKKRYPYLNWRGLAYNGLNLADYPLITKKQDYFLYLARVREDKGVLEAIEVVRRIGKKLIIAGPKDHIFFENKIQSQLSKDIIYVGDLNFKKKIKFLQNAQALLHPHHLPEAFGISMIEAQACGTPVIAYEPGASREVVQDKKTGYIVKDVKEILRAIKGLGAIDPHDCRQFIEGNFSSEAMVESYETIYKKIITR
jgi:glycosyltransferase involved in cell wall biosynthesis